jgi:hypothetical protein
MRGIREDRAHKPMGYGRTQTVKLAPKLNYFGPRAQTVNAIRFVTSR